MQRNAEQADKTVALRMPVEQVTFLERLAERNERTVSAEIRLLVRQAMEQEEQQAA
jgi:predicted DNA-binding protein